MESKITLFHWAGIAVVSVMFAAGLAAWSFNHEQEKHSAEIAKNSAAVIQLPAKVKAEVKQEIRPEFGSALADEAQKRRRIADELKRDIHDTNSEVHANHSSGIARDKAQSDNTDRKIVHELHKRILMLENKLDRVASVPKIVVVKYVPASAKTAAKPVSVSRTVLASRSKVKPAVLHPMFFGASRVQVPVQEKPKRRPSFVERIFTPPHGAGHVAAIKSTWD